MGHTRHRTKTNKAKNTDKKMSNTEIVADITTWNPERKDI